MNTPTITPVTLATCVEHSLNLSLSGFDLKRARLYGINIVDAEGIENNLDGALRISFLAEHGDVYELLDARGSSIARMFDAAAVLTCGWAAPVDDGGDDDMPPSLHPRRRRVRLVVVVGDAGVGSVLRFADTPDEIITDPDAVLASNTSSIPIMKLGAATRNPGRVLGLHFFNPVPVLPLVELVTTLVTDEAAAARTEQFAGTVLGKQVVRCSDRSGFVVNALLVPYLLAAIRMVESGFATVEDVDKAVVAGLSHPMGPLRLSDLIGLDTVKLIADKLYEEFKEPLYGPPPLLLRMVEAGRLGKKSGRGFYIY